MSWEDYSILESEKVTYVRYTGGKRKRNKRGVLVSGIYGSKVCVGWSLCKANYESKWGDFIEEGDVFDKYRGFEIAEDRALKNDRLEKYTPIRQGDDVLFDLIDDIIPQSIHADMRKFIDRAKLYYKDVEFTEVAEYIYNNI